MDYILCMALIISLSFVCFAVITTFDEKHVLVIHKKICIMEFCCMAIAAGVVCAENDLAKETVLSFFFSYLVVVSYCDYCNQRICRFWHIPAFAAGICYIALEGKTDDVSSVVIYSILITCLFWKYFRVIDFVTFIISALFFVYYDGRFSPLVYGSFHVLISVLLVLIRKRTMIKLKEKRTEEIALLPYISVSAIFIIIVGRIIEGSIT